MQFTRFWPTQNKSAAKALVEKANGRHFRSVKFMLIHCALNRCATLSIVAAFKMYELS